MFIPQSVHKVNELDSLSFHTKKNRILYTTYKCSTEVLKVSTERLLPHEWEATWMAPVSLVYSLEGVPLFEKKVFDIVKLIASVVMK